MPGDDDNPLWGEPEEEFTAADDAAADDLLAEFGEALRERDGPDSPLEDTISGYTLKRELYRGGQGVILEAVQDTTRRTVAIKLLLDGALAGRKERMRFDREVELAAQLRHPNIVTVYEGGRTDGGRRYVAMELVSGSRLDVYIRSLAGGAWESADAAIRGVGAIAVCRKLIGATNGAKAEAGTIRGDFGLSGGNNLIHGSDSPESAQRELAMWFEPDELADYTPALEQWVYDPSDLK